MDKEKLIVIAGMQRAGTTYLYEVLGQHPEIFLPKIKETNFFLKRFSEGEGWLNDLYKEAKPEQSCFDISPCYFLDPVSIKNMQEFNPHQKVILILREPNDFIVSLYKLFKKYDEKICSFEDFLEQGYQFTFDGNTINLKPSEFDYLARVEEFQKAFGDNLLLINFDYMQKNQLEILKAIEDFSGLSSHFIEVNTPTAKVNASNQQNNRFISFLSTIDILREVALAILPRKLIDYIRAKYIYGEEKQEKDNLSTDFYEDRLFDKNLFSGKGLLSLKKSA